MKILSLVSVPLRGYGFEISEQIQRLKALMEVSVPLRGYGFEIPLIGASSFPRT